MEINSEILNPKLYEKIAKEYQKNLNKNTLNYNKNNDTICDNINELKSYFFILNNFKNLSQNNQKLLNIANEKFVILEDFNKDYSNKTSNKKTVGLTYCECLTKSIICITKILKCFSYDLTLFNQTIFDYLLELIVVFTQMFGVCKYRK